MEPVDVGAVNDRGELPGSDPQNIAHRGEAENNLIKEKILVFDFGVFFNML